MPCPRRLPTAYIANTHPRAGNPRRPRDENGEVCSAVCPVCRGPMTPRLGRNGPYFFCRCYKLGDRR
jgi:hypothetical protein